MKKLCVDEMKELFYKKYNEDMKTIQIEIRQQNENVRLFNVYVGYNNKPLMLHSMALSQTEGFRIVRKFIEMNKGLITQISWERY